MTSSGSDHDERNDGTGTCPLFGVESGGPVIGLGLLIILFGMVPLVSGSSDSFPLPFSLVFIGFGIFLIWLGLKK